MKTACLILAMVSRTALIHGTSYAASSNPAPQQQSSESSAKPLNGDHATDAASAHDGERQKGGNPSDKQGIRRHISNKNHSHSQANLMKANRPKQLRNGRERSPSENVMSVAQPSSSKPAVGDAKVASNRNLPVRTTGVAALNGRQFRDPHNRGTAPAAVGGPASAARHTAAISGTGINRKRLN